MKLNLFVKIAISKNGVRYVSLWCQREKDGIKKDIPLTFNSNDILNILDVAPSYLDSLQLGNYPINYFYK